MKLSLLAAAAAAATAAAGLLGAGAASAQMLNLPSTFLGPTTSYGTLGYTFQDRNSAYSPSLGSVTGRLGARFGPYLGVEGEYSYGVDDDRNAAFKTEVQNQYAGYGVAYLPLRPNFDLFARLGYGQQDIRRGTEPGGVPTFKYAADGVNYGAGAQYFFTRYDGLRFDYTRYDPTARAVATSDTYGVSYVRRF